MEDSPEVIRPGGAAERRSRDGFSRAECVVYGLVGCSVHSYSLSIVALSFLILAQQRFAGYLMIHPLALRS